MKLKVMRTQAKRIKTDIEQLKVKQEGLKMAKDDTLKSYIAVKDEKENLKSEISALRRILENTSGASKEIFGGMGELMIGGRFVDEVTTAHREGSGDLGFRPEILVSLLNKWACFTGQRPAYKVAALQETKERMLQAQQQRESKGFKMKM